MISYGNKDIKAFKELRERLFLGCIESSRTNIVWQELSIVDEIIDDDYVVNLR